MTVDRRGNRRFRISVRTLLLIPILVGLIASFPDAVETFFRLSGTMLLVAAPAIGVGALFFRLSPHPRRALITTVLGACVGLILSPVFYVKLQSLLLLGVEGVRGYDMAPPAVGAFVFGAMGFIMTRPRDVDDGVKALPFGRLAAVAAIVSLSLTVALLCREMGFMRAEISRLRSEEGELDIDDPTRLHAIRVDTESDLEWKWRVWVPEGASYRLRSCTEKIPEEGYTEFGRTTGFWKPGQHVVRYVIRRDPSGRLAGGVQIDQQDYSTDYQPWVEWRSRTSATSGVGPKTQSYEADDLVEIVRHRVQRTDKKSGNVKSLASGFMIWLEPD